MLNRLFLDFFCHKELDLTEVTAHMHVILVNFVNFIVTSYDLSMSRVLQSQHI